MIETLLDLHGLFFYDGIRCTWVLEKTYTAYKIEKHARNVLRNVTD